MRHEEQLKVQHIHQADFTIFVHVFYPDVWEEMAAELEARVRQPFYLVITRPAGSKPVMRPRMDHLVAFTELEVDNRGRDILPFLTALKQHAMPADAIGLKLHTKRSPHRSDGDGWRRFLTASLLQADGHGTLLGHALLASEPRIGLVAPTAHLLPLAGRTSINGELMAETRERITPGTSSAALEHSRFPAGSMFWFRASALQAVVDTDVTDLFVRESGQLDGTAAHAFERLFAFIAERSGLLAAGMENANLILAHQGAPLSHDALSQLIDTTLARENPFALPLADVWRRYPTLLKCAHAIYARMPKGAVRMLRRSIGR